MFYVYEPKKVKPKSQRHTAYLYGTFNSEVEAKKWMDKKGLDIYPNVKIVQLSQENNYPDARVVNVSRSQ